MNLQELINTAPAVNITISAAELQEFAQIVVKQTLQETETARKEILIPRSELLKKVSAATLWRLERREYLIPVRRGAKVFFKKTDLEAINFNL